ncbi:MAG TPA: FtsX-like permease family protein, partial [Vicinamibacterales bacterium]
SFDERVMVFAATLCLLTGCLCSLAPAWRTRKMSLTPALSRRIGAVRSRGIPWGASLVVLQVAASLVVLAGSGLFVRTLWNLRNENLGFARQHLLLVWTTPGDVRGTGVLRANLWHAAQDRLAALPGVRTVAAADGGLLNGIDRGGDSERMKVEGQPPRPGMRVRWMVVTSRFFETAGIPLIAGRDFTERDAQTSARVTIINETMARFYFGRENPIGKHLGKPADAGYPWEIVGVVGDTKTGTPRSDSSKFIVQYFPYRQDTNNLGNMCLVVRTDGVPTSVAPRVRQALADIEPLLPVTRIDTVDEQLDDVVSRERLMATLSALLGALAALLACLGLYGLMTYTVARRTQEIGLRMALGATRSQVARHVLRYSAGLVVVGVAIGVPLALAGTRLVAAQLFGVGPGDPLTVTSATVLTVVLGVLAGIVPLYRASRVDPLIALRGE